MCNCERNNSVVGNSCEKLIALTFDDGPSDTTTTQVLDKLEKHNIPGTFFLIGSYVTKERKDILQREVSLGCEICNHSWNHPFMDKMSSEEISSEVERTSEIIYNMLGITPKFFRPPYIAVSDTMYESIDLPFICGVACNDWDPSYDSKTRAKIILDNAKDGDLVLLHDLEGNIHTVEALDSMITGLKEKGFSFVTLSELFEKKGVNPNVKHKLWTNVFE